MSDDLKSKIDAATLRFHRLAQWALFVIFLVGAGFTMGVVWMEREQHKIIQAWWQASRVQVEATDANCHDH